MFTWIVETFKWWRHTRSPDHKAHAQRMTMLEESLVRCLERHAHRTERSEIDHAAEMADKLDLVRAKRIVDELEVLIRECVDGAYVMDEATTEQVFGEHTFDQ